ncbi:MAG: NifB/NifX family molybdenum-iron cluster-binding protein [Desulfobulbaceae bacterium]|nr:NifB/NifX family molybdenum-iron cluster-binding protein [Desulfobulbaceae bacterium]
MKILVTVSGEDVSSRFDLTSEVMIAEIIDGQIKGKPRTILLGRPSAEELSGLILKENISVVICGAIEENHYRYLSWKNIKVLDSVIGPCLEAIRMAAENSLSPGDILPGASIKESAA